MIEVKPITVFLRSDLAHDPFASVYPQLCPLDGIVVDDRRSVFLDQNVAFLAVGNLKDLVPQRFHSCFACAGVLRTELLVLNRPLSDQTFGGHSIR